MTLEKTPTGCSDATHCSTAIEVQSGEYVVIVDDWCKQKLDKHGVSIKTRDNGHGKRYPYVNVDGRRISLARLVANMHDATKFVCHKNRNPLDCRKSNLIVSDNRIGAVELGPAWGAGNAYFWDDSKKAFVVMITVEKKKYYGKQADTEQHARTNVVRLAQKLFNDGVINRSQLNRFLVG